MGNLTDDMTRLRGEVDALRSARGEMMQSLATTVSAMQDDFAAAHAAMAKKTRRERVSYVARIKKQVGRMRKETAADVAGAHRAWFGKGN